MDEKPLVSVSLVGAGAHRHLRFSFSGASNLGCSGSTKTTLSTAIPPALYVDPFELETSLPSTVVASLTGDLDLERPEIVSDWSHINLEIGGTSDSSTTVSIPLHSKYGIPDTGSDDFNGKRLISIPAPSVMFKCTDKDREMYQGSNWEALHVGDSELTWALPVSSTRHITTIAIVTQLVQLICALVILIICKRACNRNKQCKQA